MFADYAFAAVQLPIWGVVVLFSTVNQVLRWFYGTVLSAVGVYGWVTKTRRQSPAFEATADAADVAKQCFLLQGLAHCSLSYVASLSYWFHVSWTSLTDPAQRSSRYPSLVDVVAWVSYVKSRFAGMEAFLALLELGMQYKTAFHFLLVAGEPSDLEVVAVDKEGGMLLSVHRPTRTLTCTIAGTSTLYDVWLDLKLWPSDAPELGPGARAHTGFLQKSRQLYPSLRTALLEVAGENAEPCTVVLCGHSMGGAVAQIFERWLLCDPCTHPVIASLELCLVAAPQPIWSPARAELTASQRGKRGRALALIGELDVTDIVLRAFGYPPLNVDTLVVTADSRRYWYPRGRTFWQAFPPLGLTLLHFPGQLTMEFMQALGVRRVGDMLRELRGADAPSLRALEQSIAAARAKDAVEAPVR